MEKLSQKRHKTAYPGVTYRIRRRKDGAGTEKVFFIRYKMQGDKYPTEQRAGSQAEGMTEARASKERYKRMAGRAPVNAVRRNRRKWTFNAIMADYWQTHETSKNGIGKMQVNIKSAFDNHLGPRLGHLRPDQITQQIFEDLHADVANTPKHSAPAARIYDQAIKDGDQEKARQWGRRLKNAMVPLAPATVYNIFHGLRALNRYAVNELQCVGMPCKIKIKKPSGKEIEILEIEQIAKVLRTCNVWPDRLASFVMRLALLSGIRHQAIYKLKWSDINLNVGIITLRGGKAREADERDYIPLNEPTRQLLKEILAWSKFKGANDPVLPNRKGQHWQRLRNEAMRKLANACGLPADFRPVHGMRHVFATMTLAHGAELTDIQKLLCHKSFNTTLIYTHHKMDNLRDVSNNMSNVVDQALAQNVRKLRKVK